MTKQKTQNELFVWNKKASRIELFVRIFYAIPVMLVLFFYGILVMISVSLQLIVILILGKRLEGLNNVTKGYLTYYTHILSYFYLTTDERPGISPKALSISEKQLYYDHNMVEIIDNDK